MRVSLEISPRPAPVRSPSSRAFTLIEVLIVVIILGILAAIVVPHFSDASHDAIEATLRSTVASVDRQVKYRRAKSPIGSYPETIDSSWFAGGLPGHPENSFGVPLIEIDATAGRIHPVDKVLDADAAGAFWYNPTEGVFRARVTDQGSSAKTLEFYTSVNGSGGDEPVDEDEDDDEGRWS
jgi:prepilin-type N-terminal cleavage/methylation domain-containing protein